MIKNSLRTIRKVRTLRWSLPTASVQNFKLTVNVPSANIISARHFHRSIAAAGATAPNTEKTFTNDFVNIKFETLTEMIEKTCKAHGTNRVFGTKNGPVFEWMSYNELWDKIEKTRNMLTQLGVNKGDNVAIISNNRWEWAAFMYATVQRGGALVPMYEQQLEKDWRYIVEDSDSKVIVVATEKIYDQVKDYAGKVGKVQAVICLDADETKPYSYQHWMKKVANDPPSPIESVTSQDLCTIIYTSGTTGKPKGVELMHQNIVHNVVMGKELVKEYVHDQTSLAFLPWAHIFGQSTELHSMISTGSGLGIVPNRDLILESIGIVKPTVMFSVPVLFNRVHDGIRNAMKEKSPVVRFLFHQALKAARERNHCLEFGKPVSPFVEWKWKTLDKIVLSKVRERLGGRLARMGAGGAATSIPVLQFFEDIGIPVMEGYGLTETSPVISAGSVDFSNRRLGCVGVPLPEVDVKIVEPGTTNVLGPDVDGEITVSGPNVMKGYRKNPKANEEVFFQLNGQRYFRTGDLGRMVEGRFLKITGRIKEQFKLENGKFVVPAPIEDIFARGPMILQSFLYGHNKKYTILLIVPNYIEVTKWAKAKHPDLVPLLPKDPAHILGLGKDEEENKKLLQLFQSPAFVNKITREIMKHSKNAKSYERPLRWYPLLSAFTQENQMMTPKMSIRRQNVITTYEKTIESIYQEEIGHKIEYKTD